MLRTPCVCYGLWFGTVLAACWAGFSVTGCSANTKELEVRGIIEDIDLDSPTPGLTVDKSDVIEAYGPQRTANLLEHMYEGTQDARAVRVAQLLWTMVFSKDPGATIGRLARKAVFDSRPPVVKDAAILLVVENTADSRSQVLARIRATEDPALLWSLLWTSAVYPVRRAEESPAKSEGTEESSEKQGAPSTFLQRQCALNEIVSSVLAEPLPPDADDHARHCWISRKAAAIDACREFVLSRPDHALPEWLPASLVSLLTTHAELADAIAMFAAETRARNMMPGLMDCFPRLSLESKIPVAASLLVLGATSADPRRSLLGLLEEMVRRKETSPRAREVCKKVVWWLSYAARERGDCNLMDAIWSAYVANLEQEERADMVATMVQAQKRSPDTLFLFLDRLDEDQLLPLLVTSGSLREELGALLDNQWLLEKVGGNAMPPEVGAALSRLQSLVAKASAIELRSRSETHEPL